MSSTKGWILLTNDDGIEAPGFRLLVQALNAAGHNLVAFAPHENNSAAWHANQPRNAHGTS
jgi:5'/3'-nucleotidase SurE